MGKHSAQHPDAKRATDKKKKKKNAAASAPAAKPGGSGIVKKPHAHGGGELVRRLEAQAPKAGGPESALAKKRKKKAAKAALLGAVGGMQASLEELLEAGDSAPTAGPSGSLTTKKRQKLVADETAHLQAVLEHPAFVADPFAALQQHISNTVGGPNSRERREGRRNEGVPQPRKR